MYTTKRISMNTIKLSLRSGLLFSAILVFCGNVNAQYRRHYGGREVYYHYSRPVVSIGLGIGVRRYGYYPSYYSSPYMYYPGGPYIGLRIGTLPFGYSSFYMGTDPFYYYGGVFYRPYGSNEYEVTAPPLGAKIPELPKNAKVTVIDGQKYYQYGGTFYKEDINDNSEIWYTVVGTNGKLNTDNTSINSDNTNTTTTTNNNTVRNDQVGDRVNDLPADSKAVVINKQKYYLSPSGMYYQEITEGNKLYYEVVGKSSDLK